MHSWTMKKLQTQQSKWYNKKHWAHWTYGYHQCTENLHYINSTKREIMKSMKWKSQDLAHLSQHTAKFKHNCNCTWTPLHEQMMHRKYQPPSLYRLRHLQSTVSYMKLLTKQNAH